MSPVRRHPLRSQEFFGAPVTDAPDHLLAYVDGGARGNPGPAGFGVLFEDHAGRLVDRVSHFLGRQTNNYAEYSALIAALEYALQHSYRALRVLSDSELMVKQMNGEYKVSSLALRQLHERARALVRQLDWFDIRHIPREENREADHLANRAMDQGTSRKPAPLPSKELSGIVKNGVIHLTGGELPEGTMVKVRVKQ